MKPFKTLLSLLFTFAFLPATAQEFKRNPEETDKEFAMRHMPKGNYYLPGDVVKAKWNDIADALFVFYSVTEVVPTETDTMYIDNLEGFVFIPVKTDSYKRVYIDLYGENGGGANIASVFFANADKDPERELVILCAWEQRHYGISGDLLETFFYDNISKEKIPTELKPLKHLEKTFHGEFNGTNEEGKQRAKYTNAAQIRKKLKELGY